MYSFGDHRDDFLLLIDHHVWQYMKTYTLNWNSFALHYSEEFANQHSKINIAESSNAHLSSFDRFHSPRISDV